MEEKSWDITEMTALTAAAEDILKSNADTKTGATVLALHGDLGAGKTTFVQQCARVLGVDAVVNSPTFVIMKKYPAKNLFQQLVHIDAYRVEKIDEMHVLRFPDLLMQKDTIICIEWAERIQELLPEDTMHLTFEESEGKRTVTVKA